MKTRNIIMKHEEIVIKYDNCELRISPSAGNSVNIMGVKHISVHDMRVTGIDPRPGMTFILEELIK